MTLLPWLGEGQWPCRRLVARARCASDPPSGPPVDYTPQPMILQNPSVDRIRSVRKGTSAGAQWVRLRSGAAACGDDKDYLACHQGASRTTVPLSWVSIPHFVLAHVQDH